MSTHNFDYNRAFIRNLGLVTEAEQQVLRSAHISIAGAGGVGGIVALSLARMGVGKFSLADLDTFGVENTNRQFGANISTYNKDKAEVIGKMIQEINPEAQVTLFPQGLHAENIADFVRPADFIVDSLDFFCFRGRCELHLEAQNQGKVVGISAPLGFSSTLQVFGPKSMSFFDYYQLTPKTEPFEWLVNFAIGLTPAGLHWSYMKIDPYALDKKYGPSIVSAVDTCAGLICTEALCLLLEKREPFWAPQYLQIDPFKMTVVKSTLPFGNRGPLQSIKRMFLAFQYREHRQRLNQVLAEPRTKNTALPKKSA